MPEYYITTKEIWYSYLHVEAIDTNEAIYLAKKGIGEVDGSDYGDTIGYVSIRDTNTGEETDIDDPVVLDEHDPNNIFVKSKKQKEVDIVVEMLDKKIIDYESIAKAVDVLKGIKNM